MFRPGMLVDPVNVSMVNVTDTEVPVVFWLARDIGGVHWILVDVDLLTMVPDALPHLYVMVWVRLVDCLVTVRV